VWLPVRLQLRLTLQPQRTAALPPPWRNPPPRQRRRVASRTKRNGGRAATPGMTPFVLWQTRAGASGRLPARCTSVGTPSAASWRRAPFRSVPNHVHAPVYWMPTFRTCAHAGRRAAIMACSCGARSMPKATPVPAR
jgi:hypothetical protein